MALYSTKFDALAESDLQALIDSGERESVGLDYKSDLGIATDEQKKEFLADVSSLANAKGGFLVFGVEEERAPDGKPTGIPKSIVGISTPNLDSEILRLENIARDGIEPRINGLRLRILPLQNGRSAIVAHVPMSLSGPHIVKYKGSSRFFSRNSAGKYPLAYSEIRSAFLRADERIQRLRSFRIERIARLIAGETLWDLGGNPMVLVHLLPLAEASVDVHQAKELRLHPIYSHGTTSRLNFEGAISAMAQSHTYVQIFRDGSIEAVSGNLIRSGEKIPSYTYEEEVLAAVPRFLEAQLKLGVAFPIAFCFSLLRVKGRQFGVGHEYWDPPPPIPKDDLIIGETLLDSLEEAGTAIKAAFDLVWQACGWPGSINFDDKGNWKTRR